MTKRAKPVAVSTAGFAAALLRWYDVHKRDLPWRRTPSAYRTLVSELMLQQTVVATVIPYFESFVARWPDARALAGARQEEVLAAWSGLGYYSRARNLLRAAQMVCDEHGGEVPLDEAALRALPGVGEYTAAAVAAIAGGRRTFALDGNAARVVARLFAVDEPIDLPATRRTLRARGESLVPLRRPGDFAQAVMELGARVCVPARPRCDECPVQAWCAAHAQGSEVRLPTRTPRKEKKLVRLACVAVVRGGRVLVVEQPKGLLAATYSLPAVELATGEEGETRDVVVRALAGTGLHASGTPRRLGEVRHIFTHRDVTAEVLGIRVDARQGASTRSLRWLAALDPGDVPLSSFARKLVAVARGLAPDGR